jgi:hypothetical protein
MVARAPSFLQQGISEYVKAMQYASDLIHGQPTLFALGSPAASSASLVQSAIAANSAANTDAVLASVFTADAKYGRTLIYTPSANPGNSNVVTVFGQDWLGQPMTESFTGASGSTAVVYGKKAFYRVLKSRNVTPASNAITYSIGTGTMLGLPYKGDLAYAMENNLQVPVYKRDFQLSTTFSVTDAVSGASLPLIAPCPGFVKNAFGSGTTTGTAGNDVTTVSLGGVAIIGLSAAIVNNTAAFLSANPTTPGYNANNRFAANAPIVLVAAALASAKGFLAGVTITPTQFVLPDLTDPATVITGDTRGTYDPITPPNGNPIAVALIGDNSVNAAGNGGLMGLAHYFNAAGT